MLLDGRHARLRAGLVCPPQRDGLGRRVGRDEPALLARLLVALLLLLGPLRGELFPLAPRAVLGRLFLVLELLQALALLKVGLRVALRVGEWGSVGGRLGANVPAVPCPP